MTTDIKLPDFISNFSLKSIGANRKVHREINLVPDIKEEMIKTLKLRNFIFFLCIVVAAASVTVTAIFGTIMGGQQIAIDNKKGTIETLSTKLNSYSDLGDFLTIKDQVSNIDTLTSNKQVLSRTFNILSAFLPTGADTITISELSVNLEDEEPTFNFEAQANSGTEPFIDYAVLEAFRKSMDEMRYDYGSYVDKNGDTIPAYCMIESGSDGAIFTDTGRKGLSSQDSNSIYAYWTITGEGCNPAIDDDDDVDEAKATAGYEVEEYEGQKVVKVWRTPQKDWYHTNQVGNQAQIDLDGKITNVAHFESACTTYSGELSGNSTTPAWTKTNDCELVPGGSTSGITISESSNGRDASDQLVLRFTATIVLAPEAYQFSNTHMLAVAPSGRHNVTDSYVQVQAMFGERASDCTEDDSACETDTTNVNGRNN